MPEGKELTSGTTYSEYKGRHAVSSSGLFNIDIFMSLCLWSRFESLMSCHVHPNFYKAHSVRLLCAKNRDRVVEEPAAYKTDSVVWRCGSERTLQHQRGRGVNVLITSQGSKLISALIFFPLRNVSWLLRCRSMCVLVS